MITCTLREAIQEANFVSGADTIAFSIPGNGPHTISPGSDLPDITRRVTIDGYTQGDSTTNTTADDAIENTIPLARDGTNAVLKIELDGTGAGIVSGGLFFNGAGASNSVIRGLVINDFNGNGILLVGGTGYRIEGNFIGTNPSGTAAEANNFPGMTIEASNSTIGGASPAARNLISGNATRGMQVGGEGGNKIEGNLIGTKANGTEALGNGSGGGDHGVIVFSSSNTIGDSGPSDGLSNAANTIAFNVGSGVTLGLGAGNGNRILSNSIFSNGGLGIDLGGGDETTIGFDVTANDDKDPDTGQNRLQNYPVVSKAETLGNFTSINGTLNSTPSTRKKKRVFIIQFFSNPAADSPSGYGEGKTFIGQTQVKTDRQGNASFSFAPFEKVPVGQYITATATNKATGDTSEFSLARVVEEPVIGGGP